MRILLWHGYLLGGTGSNVYTRALARAWGLTGHEVVVLCQEPDPEQFDLAGARVVRPDIGGPLPVFVLDRYEGLEAKLLQDFTDRERRRYVELNAGALRAEAPADLVFANHVLMGAPVGQASGLPFAVKAHGSELEYSMRGNGDLSAWGRETLAGATAVYVGSEHIRRVLDDVVGEVEHVHEVPPGVDVDAFQPEPRDVAIERLVAEAAADPPNPGNEEERLPDESNAERLAEFFADEGPVVLYFGKLIHNKGVHLLLDAVRELKVRTIVVGFGDLRAELEAMAPAGTLFTGPLDHRHLVHLLPAVDVAVVPSIFPEAFGMVAAEAASAGCPPLVARHSGLAEVAEGIEAKYPPELRHLVGFENGNVADLTAKLRELLELDAAARAELGAAARRAVVEHWSWTSVAARLLAPFEAATA
jgi:glycosyltransferase involved in cell wall biosynthesis